MFNITGVRVKGFSSELHHLWSWEKASEVANRPDGSSERDSGIGDNGDVAGTEQREIKVEPGWDGGARRRRVRGACRR